MKIKNQYIRIVIGMLSFWLKNFVMAPAAFIFIMLIFASEFDVVIMSRLLNKFGNNLWELWSLIGITVCILDLLLITIQVFKIKSLGQGDYIETTY